MSWTTSVPYGTPIVGQTPSPYRAGRSSARAWTPPPAGWAPPLANPTAAAPTETWPLLLTGALIFAGSLILAKGLRLF